jgi:hypothetical protein
MKKGFLISTIISAMLLGTTLLQAKTDNKTLVQNQIKKNKQHEKEVPKEIIEGAKKTFMAMSSLQKEDIKKAKELLKGAIKDFDKALKDNPQLNIVPIQQQIEIFEFNLYPEEIVKILDSASKLIKEHRTQDARVLLLPLKDEMDINTEFIPMGIYPIAIKNALTALDKGDKVASMAILESAFNMLITQKIILPLSLLSAQDLVMEASSIDKSRKEEALKLLDEAKLELEKAELLGYTNKKAPEYKALTTAIEKIQKEIKGKNIVEKLYDSLNKAFSSLISKIQSENKNINSNEHNEAKLKIQKTETKELGQTLKKVTATESKEEKAKDTNKTDENKTKVNMQQ